MQAVQAASCGVALCITILFSQLCAAQPVEPRPWNLSVRTFASHDTNVPLAATETTFSGNQSTNVFGLALSGDYRLYRAGQWTVAATGAIQQTRNGDPALRDFDLTSVAPGLVARYGFRLSGRPSTLSMTYGARRDWLGGSGYATGHAAGADLGVRTSYSASVGAFAYVAYNDFDDDGPDAAFSSRDAVSYRAGIRGIKSFNGNRQGIQGTLSYMKNDAKGANFVFQGPAASLQFMSFIWGPWAAAAIASFASTDYTNYAVTPRRESRTRDYRLAVFGPLSRKLSADLSIGRSEYRANQAAFEAKRENISLGITYAF